MTKARTNASVAPAVGRNMVINGAMNVAQRATSVTGIGASSIFATVDRWEIQTANSAGRLTMSQTADGPNGISANCIKLDCTTADPSIAANESLNIVQQFEGQNLQRIGKGVAGAQQITVSFYVKASAAFDFVIEIKDDDNNRHICKLFSTTTDWVRQEFIVPADVDDGSSPLDDNNASSLRMIFWLHSGTNATSGTLATAWADRTEANRAVGIDSFYSNTANNFFLTGVQMELGPVATEFEQEDIGVTLGKCQRYYQKWLADTASDSMLTGGMISDTGFIGDYFLKTSMRAVPTLATTGTFAVRLKTNDRSLSSGPALNRATPDTVQLSMTIGDNNESGFAGFLKCASNDDDAFVEFIAEL